MTPNYRELAKEFQNHCESSGISETEFACFVYDNKDTILAALELASSDRPREIAERGQWVKMERFIQLHINNEISFYQSSPKKFRMRMQSGYVQPSFQVDGDSILELMSKIK